MVVQSKLFITSLVITEYSISDINLLGADIFLLKFPLYNRIFILTTPTVTSGNRYEVCSNMNASSFITFYTYLLRQNGKRFYKGLYLIFKLVPNLMKNTVYLSSYCLSNEGHVSILKLNDSNIYQ